MKKGFRILKFKKDKPIFELKDVSKSFDGRPILKTFYERFSGRVCGVLGPNGSGKTTLFSMCIGEQNVDDGKIFINGKSIEQTPIHLRSKEGLGYLPQHRSVFNMSVYDNLWELLKFLFNQQKIKKIQLKNSWMNLIYSIYEV